MVVAVLLVAATAGRLRQPAGGPAATAGASAMALSRVGEPGDRPPRSTPTPTPSADPDSRARPRRRRRPRRPNPRPHRPRPTRPSADGDPRLLYAEFLLRVNDDRSTVERAQRRADRRRPGAGHRCRPRGVARHPRLRRHRTRLAARPPAGDVLRQGAQGGARDDRGLRRRGGAVLRLVGDGRRARRARCPRQGARCGRGRPATSSPPSARRWRRRRAPAERRVAPAGPARHDPQDRVGPRLDARGP